MEGVGAYLGLEQDSTLFASFRGHYAHFFPALRTRHRTSFVRQASNLWWLKEQLWQQVLDRIPHDPGFAILDSLPLPVCQFARASRCRRFRWGGGLRHGHVGAPDLLWAARARPLGMAR